MPPRFTLVENAVWEDPDFKRLSTDARLLFLWAWTNPNAAICGLYHTSETHLLKALEPGAEKDRLYPAMVELADKPLVLYDFNNEVVWVVNRARHANRSEGVAKRMQREVEACPESPLVDNFMAMYGQMLALRLKED